MRSARPKLAFEKPPIRSLAIDNPRDSSREPLLLALASCHSIARVVQYADQYDLVGDPMELQMFAASHMVRPAPLLPFAAARFEVSSLFKIVLHPLHAGRPEGICICVQCHFMFNCAAQCEFG